MIRLFTLLLVAVMALSACQPAAPTLGADGRPVPKAYKISGREADKIPFRMLDSVNALRGASSLAPIQLDPQLTAAAATHSRDMQVQNRPWHFGSDGSSPVDRVRRAGFSGKLVGEVISETYESELETLGAWMAQPDTRRIIMSPEARMMGISWFQENNGKIWWTMVLGD
ncbi:CAP domain-containing protein [Sulfitobacter sp.]|uniref:CAP domain-containing protein n=1 Tax=Sulfitobacter sp. TaxID=1903071 RepID=UPI003EF8614B